MDGQLSDVGRSKNRALRRFVCRISDVRRAVESAASVEIRKKRGFPQAAWKKSRPKAARLSHTSHSPYWVISLRVRILAYAGIVAGTRNGLNPRVPDCVSRPAKSVNDSSAIPLAIGPSDGV